MHATIQHHAGSAAAPADHARGGRSLDAQLGALPGFVAYVLVAEPDGGCTTVSIFEDQTGLAVADHLVAGWFAAHAAASSGAPGPSVTGEVAAQRGL